MKLQLNKQLSQRLEIGCVILLLIANQPLNIPILVGTYLRSLSYLIIFILILLSRFKKVAYVGTRDISLVLLIGLAGLSILWSENTIATANDFKGLLRLTMFGVYLATRFSPGDLMRLYTCFFGISALLSLLIGLAAPSDSISYAGNWQGIFAHKQDLSRLMTLGAVTFLFTIFKIHKYRWATMTGFCLTVTLVLLSKGKTALGALVLSLCFIPLYRLVLKQRYKLRIVIVCLLLIISVFSAILILSNLDTVIKTIAVDWMGKNLEFNGRTPVWARVIEKIGERPWLGYGYGGGFWLSNEAKNSLRNLWIMDLLNAGHRSHAHNGLLEILLQLGFIGTIMCFLYFTGLLSRLFYLILSTRKTEYFWMLHFILTDSLFHLNEALTIMSPFSIIWTIYVSISLSSAIERDHYQRKLIKSKFKLAEID